MFNAIISSSIALTVIILALGTIGGFLAYFISKCKPKTSKVILIILIILNILILTLSFAITLMYISTFYAICLNILSILVTLFIIFYKFDDDLSFLIFILILVFIAMFIFGINNYKTSVNTVTTENETTYVYSDDLKYDGSLKFNFTQDDKKIYIIYLDESGTKQSIVIDKISDINYTLSDEQKLIIRKKTFYNYFSCNGPLKNKLKNITDTDEYVLYTQSVPTLS